MDDSSARGPFRRRDAAVDGLTPRQADEMRRSGLLRSVHRGVLVPGGVDLDPAYEAMAALLAAPPGSVAGCGLALRSHGLEPALTPDDLCLVAPPGRSSHRPRLTVHQRSLPDEDRVRLGGIPATSLPRSALDACLHLSRWRAIVLLDAVLQLGARRQDLEDALGRMRGVPGVRRLRGLVEEADEGAQSPQETRMRLVLVDAGLPRPETQVEVYDGDVLVAAGDLGYRGRRLLLDYDGFVPHTERDRFRRDRRRDRRARRDGWDVLRFTDADLHPGPGGVVDEVRWRLAA